MKKHISLFLLTTSLLLSSCALTDNSTPASSSQEEATTSQTTTSNQESSSVQGNSSESISSSNIEASSSEEAISSSEEQNSSADGSDSTPPAPSHTHTWDAGTITTHATCTEDGEKTYNCTGCSETKTEKINKTGHSLEHHAANAATTTAPGNIEYWECSNCHKKYSNATGTTEIEDVVSPMLKYNVSDSNILHAWNWSIDTIISKLPEIKEAGYGTIQVSPLQVQKDYDNTDQWYKGWWKLYQPVSLSIATKAGESSIGTKTDLIELCKRADDYGINIIVDVVANHLGGANYNTFDPKVATYEKTIYDNHMHHTVNRAMDDSDVESIVKGSLGYPDLQTETEYIQNRVITMLKDYIDCGVSGFRFDAAKHIETPNDDNSLKSNFWPNVLGSVTSYAKNQGKRRPFYYGEILGQRDYGTYAYYMSITEWYQAEGIINSVEGHNTEGACDSNYRLEGVGAAKSILWAESHDDYWQGYNNKNGKHIFNEYDVDKAYVIQASRLAASSLYFVRPGTETMMGACGTNRWKSNVVSAANKFHNMYYDQMEYIANSSGCFVNFRGYGSNAGAAIVNVSDTSSQKSVNLSRLANGKYVDLVTGTEYTKSGDSLNVHFTNEVCILVPKNLNPTYNPDKVYSVNVYVTKGEENIASWWKSTDNTYLHVWAKDDYYVRATGYESQSSGKKIHFTIQLPYNPVATSIQILRCITSQTTVPTSWPGNDKVWNQGQNVVNVNNDNYYVDIASS